VRAAGLAKVSGAPLEDDRAHDQGEKDEHCESINHFQLQVRDSAYRSAHFSRPYHADGAEPYNQITADYKLLHLVRSVAHPLSFRAEGPTHKVEPHGRTWGRRPWQETSQPPKRSSASSGSLVPGRRKNPFPG
jgi:hypothetical protein